MTHPVDPTPRRLDGEAALKLIATLAGVLNSGQPPDEALRQAMHVLREGLGAAAVALWRRESSGITFHAVSSPDSDRSTLTLDNLPVSAEGAVRMTLAQGGIRLGLLEVEGLPADLPLVGNMLQCVANVLTPFLDAMALAEDLASEVASRSREIDEQRRFTALIIDSLPVGLYVIDRDYRIQVWNRKRETGTQGLRRDEVVGRPVFEVLSRQPAAQLRTDFDRIFRSGEMQRMEIETGSGGDRRYYRITKVPMRLDGDAITHIITIGEDITESHKIQQQILQSEKLAAIGQLAAGVMHEINNPLATIGACVTAIEGRLPTDTSPQSREYLKVIQREVERCTRIVDGLLDFSRPRPSGRHKTLCQVNSLVEETLFLVKHHQRFRKINVVKHLAPDLPPVNADGEQLIQVFMALMLNAMDAMERGGDMTIRTMLSPGRQDELMIEIADTGVGISPNEMSKIFEPFFTTKPPGRGTGLGLSIVYGILQEHAGRIDADSEPGRGSVFRVYLPIAEAMGGAE